MSYFDQNYLIQLLQDLDPTQDHITAASRYIGRFPEYAKESVDIWEEQLSNCFGERKLLFLYVLNDVIQVYRGSEVSRVFIDRLDSVLYSVIHESPSLQTKVNRLISVWKDRSVVSNEKIQKYERIVQNALNDYENQYDNYTSNNQKEEEEEEEEDPYQDTYDNHYQNDEPPSFSDNSEIETNPLESVNDYEEMKECEKNQLVTEAVLREGSQIGLAEEEVDHFRHDLRYLPDWVLSVDDFSRELPELVEQTEDTNYQCENAKNLSIQLQNALEKAISSRKRIVPCLVEMKERKKRRIERLERIIHESESVLDLLQSLDEGEDDIIMRLVRKPRLDKVNSLNLSSEALQSITKTLKKAEEEEEEKKRLEKEKQQREAEIRDDMNHSIMKTSAEEMMGKAWNARSLFDRILSYVY